LKVPKAVKYVVVSFVGYKNAKLDVTKTTEFKVMLQPDQEQLTEVVVTGYQQIEKRKVTSAIQTVKMDDIKRIGVASIDQLLEGRVAGHLFLRMALREPRTKCVFVVRFP